MEGFDLKEYQEDIEAISIALGMIHYRELEVQPVVEKSIVFLKEQYNLTKERKFLETALLIMQAFLNNGFLYEDEQRLFDEILMLLGNNRQVIFPKRFYASKRIRLTRPQVRNMIRKWMPSKENPMKIGEVVDDIIQKVSEKKIGHYYYRYRRSNAGKNDEEKADLYELVIMEHECFFCDIRNRKYYTFY